MIFQNISDKLQKIFFWKTNKWLFAMYVYFDVNYEHGENWIRSLISVRAVALQLHCRCKSLWWQQRSKRFAHVDSEDIIIWNWLLLINTNIISPRFSHRVFVVTFFYSATTFERTKFREIIIISIHKNEQILPKRRYNDCGFFKISEKLRRIFGNLNE